MQSPPSPRSEPRPAAQSRRATRRRASERLSAAALVLLVLAAAGCGGGDGDEADSAALLADRFDAPRAFELIEEQVAVGQRPAGSPQLRRLAERLRGLLPNGRIEPLPGGLQNVVGTIPGREPAIVIGAHYDTEYRPPGFVGANDGAAGTAAVVELARTLERELEGIAASPEVRFVLFDGEEEPPGCPEGRFAECALRGSKAYAAAHAGEIGQVILLDYVANEGLRIPREANSDPALWERLRGAAARVGAGEVFPAEEEGGVIDDHVPFLAAGIPAIDLIDFSYRYADTVEDTPDKLSEADLDAVGETVAELVRELAQSGAGEGAPPGAQ
jgi:glutaminyl-peptide cyclotransferase